MYLALLLASRVEPLKQNLGALLTAAGAAATTAAVVFFNQYRARLRDTAHQEQAVLDFPTDAWDDFIDDAE